MVVTKILKGGTEVIERISIEWTELCDEGASGEPFLRPEWFSAFVKNFEKEIELVTVRRNGRLRAVLPLMKKRGKLHGIPVRKLQAVFNLHSQRFDLIHGSDETEKVQIVNAVWTSIKDRSGWDVFETRLVKKDSWLGDILAHAKREKYATGTWQMDNAPFITLPESGDEQSAINNFFKGPRKHLRQELDRRLRRLKELGAVEFIATRGCTQRLLQTYFDLEAKGWKGRGGTAVTDDPYAARMHEDFAREMAIRQALFIYELKLDGKTIAMSMNIPSGKEIIHWKTSYDEDYARYSPGNILFREFLIDCVRNGSNEIDFMSPASKNKRAWATGERQHVAFYIFRRGFFGTFLWNWKFFIVSGVREFVSKAPVEMVPAHAQK